VVFTKYIVPTVRRVQITLLFFFPAFINRLFLLKRNKGEQRLNLAEKWLILYITKGRSIFHTHHKTKKNNRGTLLSSSSKNKFIIFWTASNKKSI